MSNITSPALQPINLETSAPTEQPKKKGDGSSKKNKKDRTRKVVEMMRYLGTLFHDANGGEDADTYIRIKTGNKSVVYSLDSAMVRRLMRNNYRIASGGAIIGRDSEDQAIKSLQAILKNSKESDTQSSRFA